MRCGQQRCPWAVGHNGKRAPTLWHLVRLRCGVPDAHWLSACTSIPCQVLRHQPLAARLLPWVNLLRCVAVRHFCAFQYLFAWLYNQQCACCWGEIPLGG